MRSITAIAVVFALLAPAAASTRTLPVRSIANERTSQIELHGLARQVARERLSTWRCQDTVGTSRTRASASAWALPTSIPYRRWVRDRWAAEGRRCASRLSTLTLPASWDWLTAVRMVQRVYPGTSDWLLYISHREGGWGRFVMNTQGSGAGGWMQFMSSTYYAYNDRAFADARRRGFIISERANSWTHPMGQALTAGYMRYVHLDGCHWCL